MTVAVDHPWPRLRQEPDMLEWARRLVEDLQRLQVEFGTAINAGGGGGGVTSIAGGTGMLLTPDPIVGVGTVAIATTGVTPGVYPGAIDSIPTLSINAQGQVDSAFDQLINIATAQVLGLDAALAALQPLDADLTQIAAVANVRGDLLVTDAGPTWVRLGLGAANRVLGVNNAATDPEYKDILGTANEINVAHAANSITIGLVDPVIATKGGTGFASFAVGDVLYADTTTTLAKLADIATGNVLHAGGVGVAPAWAKVTASDFTSATDPFAGLYTLLAGRAGTANDTTLSTDAGGILAGSAAASQNLTLKSTTHATKGAIVLDDTQTLWPSFPTTPNALFTLAKFNPTGINVGTSFNFTGYNLSPTFTWAGTPGGSYQAFNFAPTFIHAGDASTGTIYTFSVFACNAVIESTGATSTPMFSDTFTDFTIHKHGGTGTCTNSLNWQAISFVALPAFKSTNGGTMNNMRIDALMQRAKFDVTVAGGALRATRRGLAKLTPFDGAGTSGVPGDSVTALTLTADGTVTIDHNYGLYVPDQRVSTDISGTKFVRVTRNSTVWSELVTSTTTPGGGTTNRCIYDTGGAPSEFKGAHMQAYASTGFDCPTGYFSHFVKRHTLTGTQRATLQGTARWRGN